MFRHPVSANLLQTCDLESPITASTCVECDAFEAPFLEAAKREDEQGSSDQALVYRLLACLCSFQFKPSDKMEPFSNKMAFANGSRTLMGSDFTLEEVEAVKAAVLRVRNLALRTRLADFVWSRIKSSSECARLAIDGYVGMVRGLVEGSATERFSGSEVTGVATEEFLMRAILIARSTGWHRTENDALRQTLREVLEIALARDDMAIVRFGELAFEVNLEGVAHVFDALPAKVDELTESDTFVAEGIQKLVVRVMHVAGDEILKREAHLKLARIYESRAEKSTNAMLKAHAFQEAIDSLHGIQGVKQDRQRIFDRLKEAQLHMVDEFGKVEHSIDLSDEVKRILDIYEEMDLLDCLVALATSELPKDPKQLVEKAQEEAQRFPLSTLFSTSIVDSKGRTTARSEGGGIENESTLRHKIIQHEDIRIGLAVTANIMPVRELITRKFDVSYDLIFLLCKISPFVPSGLEHAFARGVRAFFYADDFFAGAALIPILEAGLRSLVIAAGRSDTKISTGGIEETIGIGPLLSNHRDVLERVFTPAIVFCIENLFVHELGPKIRHNYCHGMTSDRTFSSASYVYATKLIFSLILLPLLGQGWSDVKAHIENKLR